MWRFGRDSEALDFAAVLKKYPLDISRWCLSPRWVGGRSFTKKRGAGGTWYGGHSENKSLQHTNSRSPHRLSSQL